MSKNVAVFVDVANIFYAAKAAGIDIDYVTLLKSATAGRDFVRAYAYTGLDPENENQRQFHSFLARSGYKVISKDIRKYGDGPHQGEPGHRAGRRHDEDGTETWISPSSSPVTATLRRPSAPCRSRASASRSSASAATPAPTSSRSRTCSPTSPRSRGREGLGPQRPACRGRGRPVHDRGAGEGDRGRPSTSPWWPRARTRRRARRGSRGRAHGCARARRRTTATGRPGRAAGRAAFDGGRHAATDEELDEVEAEGVELERSRPPM